MKYRFTYQATCFVDVVAETEEEAIEKAEDMFPYEVEIQQITLYDKNGDDHEWEQADRFNEDRRLGI